MSKPAPVNRVVRWLHGQSPMKKDTGGTPALRNLRKHSDVDSRFRSSPVFGGYHGDAIPILFRLGASCLIL